MLARTWIMELHNTVMYMFHALQIIINLHVSLDWNAACPLTIINSLEGRSTALGVGLLIGIAEIGSPPDLMGCTQDWVKGE